MNRIRRRPQRFCNHHNPTGPRSHHPRIVAIQTGKCLNRASWTAKLRDVLETGLLHGFPERCFPTWVCGIGGLGISGDGRARAWHRWNGRFRDMIVSATTGLKGGRKRPPRWYILGDVLPRRRLPWRHTTKAISRLSRVSAQRGWSADSATELPGNVIQRQSRRGGCPRVWRCTEGPAERSCGP